MRKPFFCVEIDEHIAKLLDNLRPITLEQMQEIRLMNRTDTKFVTDKDKLMKLLRLIQDEYFVQTTGGSRVANYKTVYWDTEDYRFYLEHHNRRLPRQKVRVRTYIDSKKSFLEVKTKNNHGRTQKERMGLPSEEIIRDKRNEEFLRSMVQLEWEDLRPTVWNEFHRITLVNYGKTERLTIDFDVQFHNMETGRQATTGPLVVIELKRNRRTTSPITGLLRQLHIMPSGFSKYCIGSVMTNEHLKRNLFKKKMVKLDKIINN